MTSPLIPTLNGRQLTVDVALKQPTLIRNQIAKLADDQILLPKFFRQFGAKVEGGGMLYSVVQASDFFTREVEKRSPASEYKVVEGVDPEPQLALVEDWGGKFQIAQEDILRNNVNYLDQQTTQLANTIARKLDTRAVAAVQAADIGAVTPVSGWTTSHSWARSTPLPPASTGQPPTSLKRKSWPTSKSSASPTTCSWCTLSRRGSCAPRTPKISTTCSPRQASPTACSLTPASRPAPRSSVRPAWSAPSASRSR